MARELSISEAADRLGVSRQVVYTLIDDGALPARRMGLEYRIDPEDLRRLGEGAATPTPHPDEDALRDRFARGDW